MAGSDWLTKELKISMADPLPHPSEDKPQRPNPNNPPSSPWLPGKSPAPSKKGLVDLRIKKGAIGEDGTRYPMPVIESEPGLHDGIGPNKELFDFFGKYGTETIQANVNNPRMDIMLPFSLPDDDSKYGVPEGTDEEKEELYRRGWASRPNQENMQIASTIPGDILNPMSREEWQRFLQSNPNVLKKINSAKQKLKI